MKKQRWRFTKVFSVCGECGRKLDIRNKFHGLYGTCNQTCELHSVGMSLSDFY
ncbi:hypothetical protein [Bacillus sp. AFS098217]|uniref:hypothetical protein n=1 Tax=Bacillus sp. AFS098217 TaxID=2033868 RepID=UPI0015CF6B02|nr:hypothetical protein [Bacillus sp. AFS098217]